MLKDYPEPRYLNMDNKSRLTKIFVSGTNCMIGNSS